MNRTLSSFLFYVLKGMAMGAADVVPGVSGGTVAFITGIYEKLIDSLSQIDLSLITGLRRNGLVHTWKRINGGFLSGLFLGIGISIVSLARLITWLIEHHPIALWSFFSGLISASVWYIWRQIENRNIPVYAAFVTGAVAAYLITNIYTSVHLRPSGVYLFFSGAIAISAMILPGISGSFILVILGTYQFILNAIHQRDLISILWFGAGAITGLLTFVKFLKFLFSRFRNTTLGLLSGFVLGALNKIWPWKDLLQAHPRNIMPWAYEGNPQTATALILFLAGFSVVYLIEKQQARKT